MLKQIQQLGANTLGTLQGLGRATLMLFGDRFTSLVCCRY